MYNVSLSMQISNLFGYIIVSNGRYC